MLRANRSATWSLLLFYKDGKNPSQNHGRLEGWDNQSFTQISIDLFPDGIMAGWTGNESAIAASWSDIVFDPNNPKGLGDAIRSLSFAQNETEGGGHTLKRFSVYRAEA